MVRRVFSTVLASAVAAILIAPATSAAQEGGPIAPELTGLGTLHMPVTTSVPQAQRFFDQGLRLLYAFNHAEAIRAFREAARLDPGLAMAHWGRAIALGPNLNAPMTQENGRQAYAAIRQARALSSRATPREQTLIEALALRYAADGKGDRAALDRAYAGAMQQAAGRFEDDPDVQTLFVDAQMNTMPWDYWQKDGTAKPETAHILTVLETVIARQPDHAGALHYHIHLLEASADPDRAEASADRLGSLMPSAGHMVHMPAHIYIRVGRYADAAEVNVRAIAADEDYLAQCQAQGLYPVSYQAILPVVDMPSQGIQFPGSEVMAALDDLDTGATFDFAIPLVTRSREMETVRNDRAKENINEQFQMRRDARDGDAELRRTGRQLAEYQRLLSTNTDERPLETGFFIAIGAADERTLDYSIKRLREELSGSGQIVVRYYRGAQQHLWAAFNPGVAHHKSNADQFLYPTSNSAIPDMTETAEWDGTSWSISTPGGPTGLPARPTCWPGWASPSSPSARAQFWCAKCLLHWGRTGSRRWSRMWPTRSPRRQAAAPPSRRAWTRCSRAWPATARCGPDVGCGPRR